MLFDAFGSTFDESLGETPHTVGGPNDRPPSGEAPPFEGTPNGSTALTPSAPQTLNIQTHNARRLPAPCSSSPWTGPERADLDAGCQPSLASGGFTLCDPVYRGPPHPPPPPPPCQPDAEPTAEPSGGFVCRAASQRPRMILLQSAFLPHLRAERSEVSQLSLSNQGRRSFYEIQLLVQSIEKFFLRLKVLMRSHK